MWVTLCFVFFVGERGAKRPFKTQKEIEKGISATTARQICAKLPPEMNSDVRRNLSVKLNVGANCAAVRQSYEPA